MDPLEFWERQQDPADGVRQLSAKVWAADSPERAAAWLRVRCYWPATVMGERALADGRTQAVLPRRPFFRGQARSAWKPTPKLLRETGPVRDRLTRAARLAASVIDVVFETLYSGDGAEAWPRFDEGSGMAAAQHYGIATDLLDWTANPSVAVQFATCGSLSAHSREAIVHIADIGALRDIGLRTVMPPVYVERLYVQRGLFTRLDERQVLELDRRCTKLVFPPRPRRPALATADGERFVEIDLLPAQEWYDRLKDWSEEHADDEELLSNPAAASAVFERAHGKHPAIESFPHTIALLLGEEHTAPIISYIRELAGRSTRSGFCFDPAVLDCLRADNPRLFEWLGRVGVRFPRCY